MCYFIERTQKCTKLFFNHYLKDLDSLFNKSVKALNDDLREFQDMQKLETDDRHNDFDYQKNLLDEQQKAELEGKGVDVNLLAGYRKALEELSQLLQVIESHRDVVIRYRYAEENLFAKEPEIRKSIKDIENQVAMLRQRYEDKRSRIE